MNPLAPSTVLQNRYQVIHLIGKGGMGEVYLAIDQRLGNSVALKRTFFNDEAMWQAFEREARILANLRHQVLPKVSDHFTENGNQYLVMDYIAGDDLAAIIKKHNAPFPLNQVLTWSDQLLDALEFLHSHKPPIVHRDIKPQNLKFTPNNHIVLLDFGLAKNTVGQTRVSSNGSVVGYTPNYAPMEQVRGTGTEARSDIYSLSATLYQLLTNLIPADTLSRAGDMLEGLPDPMRHVSEVNTSIPKPIGDVIMKGVALRMEQRHANAREMRLQMRAAYTASQEIASNGMPAKKAQKVSNDAMNVTVVDPSAQIQPSFASQATEVFSTADILQNQPQDEEVLTTPQLVEPPKAVPTPESLKETVEFSVSDHIQENYAENETDSLPQAESLLETPHSPANEPVKEVFLETFPVFTNEVNGAEKTLAFDPKVETSTSGNTQQDYSLTEEFTETFDEGEVLQETPSPKIETSYQPLQVHESISPTPIPAKKKSGSKGIFALIGGVLLLGLLAFGSVLGIYLWKSGVLGGSIANTSNNSTPSPTPTETPAENSNNNSSGIGSNDNSNDNSSNLNSNNDSNNSNDSVSNSNDNTKSNSGEEKTPKPTPTVEDVKPNSTPKPNVQPTPKLNIQTTPTPRPVVISTPRPVVITTPKPTVTPKKPKTGGREILQ